LVLLVAAIYKNNPETISRGFMSLPAFM
jgi:hypothetical protein